MASPDLLRRFTPTPLLTDLRVMGRMIRLETDSPGLSEQVRRAFNGYSQTRSTRAEFTWRLVAEADSRWGTPWPEMAAYSDEDLSFVNMGQRGFLAVDSGSREAVGFLDEEFTKNPACFSSRVLAMLFFLSASSLGLTPFAAACVGRGDKGFLVFGPAPNSETRSCLAEGNQRPEFYMNPVVFLEHDDRGLRGWSEFWKAALEGESQRPLPELRAITRAFDSEGHGHADPSRDYGIAGAARAIIPVASIFLERPPAAVAQLVPLSSSELRMRLQNACLLKDDKCAERANLRASLGDVPGYRLGCGDDPRDGMTFLRALLNSEDLWELTS